MVDLETESNLFDLEPQAISTIQDDLVEENTKHTHTKNFKGFIKHSLLYTALYSILVLILITVCRHLINSFYR